MTEYNEEEILKKVRHNKEALDAAQAELAQLRDELRRATAELRETQENLAGQSRQIEEKDEAICDLLVQNEDLHQKLGAGKKMSRADAKSKDGLLKNLSDILE